MEYDFFEKNGNLLQLKINPWKQSILNENSMENKDADWKSMEINFSDGKTIKIAFIQ